MAIRVQKILSSRRYFPISVPGLVRKSSSWIVHSLLSFIKREQREYT